MEEKKKQYERLKKAQKILHQASHELIEASKPGSSEVLKQLSEIEAKLFELRTQN